MLEKREINYRQLFKKFVFCVSIWFNNALFERLLYVVLRKVYFGVFGTVDYSAKIVQLRKYKWF